MRHATISTPAWTFVSSKFGKYRPEEELVVRRAKVKEDSAVEAIKALYRKHIESGGLYQKECDSISSSLKNHCFSTLDIEKFSIAFAEFQKSGSSECAGLFLSALINNGKDKDYTFHTAHLDIPIWWLGYKNTKNIIVDRNIPYGLGFEMKAGIIIVSGFAGRVGQGMKGGEIHIEGEIGSIGNIIHGKIFHKGKLIVDK